MMASVNGEVQQNKIFINKSTCCLVCAYTVQAKLRKGNSIVTFMTTSHVAADKNTVSLVQRDDLHWDHDGNRAEACSCKTHQHPTGSFHRAGSRRVVHVFVAHLLWWGLMTLCKQHLEGAETVSFALCYTFSSSNFCCVIYLQLPAMQEGRKPVLVSAVWPQAARLASLCLGNFCALNTGLPDKMVPFSQKILWCNLKT